MSRDFPAAVPHGAIEALTERLFVVHGGIRLKGILRISRNMAILRDGDALTLVNPIRLDAEGEAALERLGTVKRILRLGAMHGIDDPYYKHRFGAEFWCQVGGGIYPAGGSLRGEFERLLELDFDALLAAHGTWLPAGAKAGVRRAVATMEGLRQQLFTGGRRFTRDEMNAR